MKTALKYIIAHISDSSNKMIHISVFHGKDTDKLSLDDLKEPTDVKTIKGYDGLLDLRYDGGLYFFTYIKNGKVSIVTVEDESLLGELLFK